MFYAYVIRSLKDNSLYKGHCEDLVQRLAQHNSGMTKSIKMKTPFIVVYFEEFESRDQAIRREKYSKSAAGRKYLSLYLAPQFNARPNDVQSGGDRIEVS